MEIETSGEMQGPVGRSEMGCSWEEELVLLVLQWFSCLFLCLVCSAVLGFEPMALLYSTDDLELTV